MRAIGRSNYCCRSVKLHITPYSLVFLSRIWDHKIYGKVQVDFDAITTEDVDSN